MENKPMIVLAGPTAVGKTELSLRLAKALNGSVISADSMQVYRHMDIGSAKIKPDEKDGVSHYLIDCLEPEESFNVSKFKEMAKTAAGEIYAANKIPIVVGGTGFYIQALLKDVDFTEYESDESYRKSLEEFERSNGSYALHQMLEEVDPVSASRIHENNVKRTIRALEYYKLTNEPISLHNETERKKSPAYNYAYFVLNMPRSIIYDRINARVDKMMKAGLLDEVRRLAGRGCTRDMTSMQGLGYKEIMMYLDGECSLDEAVYLIKRNTRHFAKRQLTWFAREKDAVWINKESFADDRSIIDFMLDILKSKAII